MSGNLLTITTGEQTTSYEYNYQNQPVKVTNPEGNSQTTEYDALGRTVAQTDFLGNTTEMEYDALGRQVILRAPFDGETKAITKNYYDANGNVTKTLVQDNAPGAADSFKKTEYTYDGRNRLVSTAVYADDNTPNYTQYKYDNVGNTTAVYTGLSAPLNLTTLQGADMDYAVTQYVYNDLNQPVAMTDALGQTTTYTYDYAGNVTQMTDRNGTVTNVAYNLWGAPVTRSAAKDGTVQTITNTYDALGLLRSTTDENGTTTYDYDAMGRLTEEEIGDTINSYSYDMYGNRTAYTLTRGGAVLSATNYTYDSMNRLATMTNGGVTTSYTYDANGQVLTEQGGGYSASYTYNDGGLLTAKVGTGAAGEVLDVSYSHALDGNILQKNDEDEGVTTYAYDGAGRLTSEVNGQANVTNSYSYDAYGNRTGAVLGGTAVSYTYDKNNRLTKESATAGGATTDVLYQYDPNGNRVSIMTSKTETEQADAPGISLELPQLETALNRYDAFGRLVESEVTKEGALTQIAYTYNASGYRTSKTVDGVTTEHLLDGANVAADVANGQVTQYVRGLGLTALVQADGTRLQYVTDGHGDVKKLVNSSGAVVADYTYDAFGNQTEEAEDVNPFRYAGEYWDSESGLIYLRARYYDSGVGAFTSEDPAKDGLNWYVYCGGNPVNFWDPTGNHAETVRKIQRLLELKNNWTTGTLTESGAAEAKSIKEWLKNESPLNSYSLFNSYVHEIFDNEIDTLEFTNILLEIAAYTGNVYYGKDGGNLAEISNIYDAAVALINDSDPGSASIVFSEKGAKSRYWNTTRKVNVYTLETGKIGHALRYITVTLYVDSSRPSENISEVKFGRGNLIIKDYNSPFTSDPSSGKGVGEFE